MTDSILLFPELISRRVTSTGPGYIAGISPGILTVNGAPAARQIEVRDRKTRAIFDVFYSEYSGEYQCLNVDPSIEFDVISRDFTGEYNDTIVSRVRPEPYDVTTITDETVVNPGTGALDGFVRVFGGLPGHTVDVTAGTAPAGMSFSVEVVSDDDGYATFAVIADGTADSGSYTWTLTVTAPNGSSKSIELTKTWP